MAYTTINNGKLYFNTLTWTGADTSAGRDFIGVGFQPDLVWAKTRSVSNGHKWFDIVRGVGKSLQSEGSGAETTNDGNGYIDSFDSDGFSSIAGSSNNYNFNNTSTTIVAWNWKAGNSQGSSNTDGSINTTYTSVNTTAGFSISQYTGNGVSGATVGHGLGAIPKWIIVKALNTTDNWEVYHASLGAEKYIELNLTAAQGDSTAIWNDTEPTSSLFSIGNNSGVNTNGNPYIAYCFAEKKGYSKFGSYTGNGNADGTFVYTGFKPAFVIVKRTDAVQGWYILDNKRNTFNPEDKYLETSDSDAEATFTFCDFLSNGFKARTTGTGFNASGGSYIYMAFAENPFTSSTGTPVTAR